MLISLFILFVIYLLIYSLGLPLWLSPSSFYIGTTIIYLVLNVWYLCKYRKNNLFCFELLFAISFWLCCFFLPIVMEQLDPSIQSHSILLNFSDFLLCRAIALCVLGYMSYMIGLIPLKSRIQYSQNHPVRQSPMVNKVLNYLTLLTIFLFFVLGGANFIYSYDQSVDMDALAGGRFGRFGAVMLYAITLLNISSVSNIITTKYVQGESVLHFIKKLDFIFLLNLLIMSAIFLLGGYRSGAMQILLPFFAMLSYKRVLKTKHAVFLIILGGVLMALIGQFRGNTSTISDVSSEMTLLSFFRDFISVNAATPSLVEYSDFYGTSHFRNALPQILAVVPFLQSLVFMLFGSDYLRATSSEVFTYDICRSFNSGKGTNIIGDLYYTDGFFCVLIMMFFLGWVIRKTSFSKNKYALLISVCMIGNAVFMPRVEFFYIARTCGFAVIIYWLINKLFSVRRSI